MGEGGEYGTAGAAQILAPYTIGTEGGLVTGTIPSRGTATITPGTTNQTIAAGQYLAGSQTIAGSGNLKPENIVDGINIFGIVGNYSTSDIIKAEENEASTIISLPTAKTHNNNTPTVVKRFTVNASGSYRIIFRFNASNLWMNAIACGQIFINNVARGTLHEKTNTTSETKKEDFTLKKGDIVELKLWVINNEGVSSVGDFTVHATLNKSILTPNLD